MKGIAYCLVGVIIGAIMGFVVGAGNTRYMNKTERGIDDGISAKVWALLGAVVCGGIGLSVGVKEEENERKRKEDQVRLAEMLEEERQEQERVNGILNRLGWYPSPEPDYYKEGRYWVGITKWTDPRNGKEYSLKTHKDSQGRLVTTIGAYAFTHDVNSASKEVVPAAHNTTRKEVVKRLLTYYERNHHMTVEDVFPQV